MIEEWEKSDMKKWKLWAGMLLLFLAGVCIGAAGAGLYVRHTVQSILQEGPPAVARLITKKLSHDLGLSGPQQKAVEKVVRETQNRLHNLRQQHWPEAEQIFTSGIHRIKADLSPEQQIKLDASYDRIKERWKMKSEGQK